MDEACIQKESMERDKEEQLRENDRMHKDDDYNDDDIGTKLWPETEMEAENWDVHFLASRGRLRALR